MNNLKKSALTVAASASILGMSAVAAAADCGDDTLCKIKEAGVLKIGTKDDYVPWSYRNSDGNFIGMEVDLGNKIAEALGVDVEYVKVNSANRFEFLAQGQIDLMIASASDTAQRREIVNFVYPNYYSSGYTVFLPKAVTATKWEEIKGQVICSVQGAWYNKPAQEQFGIEVLAFAGTVETETAMTQGRCIGILEDDNVINVRLSQEKWADYHNPLPIEADTPWGMAVRHEDKGSPYYYTISGLLTEFHRDGSLLEMEAANGIKNSPFLIKMNDALKDHIE